MVFIFQVRARVFGTRHASCTADPLRQRSRCQFSTGVCAAGYGKGTIVAWMPLEDSDFEDSAGQAAPLWRLVYDEVRLKLIVLPFQKGGRLALSTRRSTKGKWSPKPSSFD